MSFFSNFMHGFGTAIHGATSGLVDAAKGSQVPRELDDEGRQLLHSKLAAHREMKGDSVNNLAISHVNSSLADKNHFLDEGTARKLADVVERHPHDFSKARAEEVGIFGRLTKQHLQDGNHFEAGGAAAGVVANGSGAVFGRGMREAALDNGIHPDELHFP